MTTIFSASRRTDYPAFFTKNLIQGITNGNLKGAPVEPGDGFVFWTKDARPLMPYLEMVKNEGLYFYFQYTITNYGPILEKTVPPAGDSIRAVQQIAETYGKDSVVWRYDPILLSEGMTPDWHINNFTNLLWGLQGFTNEVVLSIYDPYPKIQFQPVPFTDTAWIEELVRLARTAGLKVSACSEKLLDLPKARCVDPDRLHRLGMPKVLYRKDPKQRIACGCAPSVDIGTYDTCKHGCIYCYATHPEKPPQD